MVALEGALAVALLAWHGKHQTAGVVCPGTGKLDAGSSLHVTVGAVRPPLVACGAPLRERRLTTSALVTTIV